MAEPPILSWEGLGLQQGGRWLFENLDLHIGPRDRLALIGRNGVGKTTLFRLIKNRIEADRGERKIKPGTRIVLLEQDPDFSGFATLMDFALAGEHPPLRHEVEAIAGQLGIDMAREAASASGGEKRRAALARALAQQPGLLLMDEPTNHLDLAGIEWLESWLRRYKGAFVVISHDRTFLKRLTQATLWLDRGTLRRKEVGFGGYEAWEEAVYAEQARAAEKLDAKLKIEAHWLERGVTARRKRNQGRLEKLWQMRAQRAAMLSPQGAARLALATDEETRSKTVINAEHVTKRYGERTIIRDFSLRIQRGDRIGVVGANGAGKTTLLKLLEPALIALAPRGHTAFEPVGLELEPRIELFGRARFLGVNRLFPCLVAPEADFLPPQRAAVEPQRRAGQALEERAVVADDDERALVAREPRFKPLDGRQVEVIGRLVEQQQIGRLSQGAGEGGAAPFAAAGSGRLAVHVDAELAGNRLDLVPLGRVVALQREVHQCLVAGEVGILLEQDDPSAGLDLASPAIGLDAVRDQPQERRLADPVSSDQRQPVARADMQVEGLEQPAPALLQAEAFPGKDWGFRHRRRA